MHRLEVILAVVSPDIRRLGNSCCLMVERDGVLQLPSAELPEDKSTLEVAAELLHRATGLEARIGYSGWVDLVPLPLADATGRVKAVDFPDGSSFTRRVIGVPYGAMMPSELVKPMEKCRWVPLVDALQEGTYLDHAQIIQAACNHI